MTTVEAVSDDKRNIHERLVDVSASIDFIAKDLSNERFKARGIDDVFAAFHGPLGLHGISLLPDYELLGSEFITSTNGQRQHAATVKGTFTWVGLQGDAVTSSGIGFAIDSSDKAFNQAMQAAFKYVVLQQFTVPVGDVDADSKNVDLGHTQRAPTPAPAPGIAQQVAQRAANTNSGKAQTGPQGKKAYALSKKLEQDFGWSREQYLDAVELFGGEGVRDDRNLTFDQISALIKHLMAAAGQSEDSAYTPQGPPPAEAPPASGYGWDEEPF